VAVVRRMLRDLHLDDVELVVGPTIREPDGLAMSSRNAYLDPSEREAALSLSRGLNAAVGLAEQGERDGKRLESAARAVIAADTRVELEYVAVVDPDSFMPVSEIRDDALMCIAARVGDTRLIDNMSIPTSTRRNHVPPLGRTMLKSKIHRATVTDANLDYVGSITLDRDLLEAADIKPYEQVQVLDINNGARFETYAIEGPRGGRDVCLNGPAARLVQPGDIVIVLTYADYPESELEDYAPLVVHVDEENNPVGTAMLETVPDDWEPYRS
jgi:aspartate 1-decarboxylase